MYQFTKEKKYQNLNVKNIVDNKKFWEKVKAFFSEIKQLGKNVFN